MNEAPHYCDASCVSMETAGLIQNRRYHIEDDFATAARPSRLERPGIEPGAARCIRPAVDTIDAPQRLSIPRPSVNDKSARPFEKAM